MTERKAFKRRVRAQMGRTGQTYAQAAAQLEAGNPAHRSDAHPASAIVVALLNASGMTLDPVAAYGVGGGIGFMYALFRYQDSPQPLLTLVCQHHPAPWAPAILERLGVDHTATVGKRELGRLLGEERPLVVPVACGAVPWLTSDPLTEREECVVLALPDGEHIRIFDGTGAHARIAPDALLAAYTATRRRHPILVIDHGARLPADLRPAIASGLRATIAGMSEPVLGNAFDVNFGLRGLRRWAERVTDTGGDGWAKAFADPTVWQTRLVQCIDTEYTAPTAGRPLFARLLRDSGHLDAADAFDRSAQRWHEIVTGARRGTLDLVQLAALVTTIADDEQRGITALRTAMDSLRDTGAPADS
ncbi:hypothetical protein [Microbacterium invictum]|uniref:Butirosin biosynthesis protein H N-terminal domain-containing protein n=1 Tax=Microbacterium invictum TaxID=515415 RepID=A0AA40SQU0_9MICO|nr:MULTISPECIES: hypothetical protein [Microbacterium]MBB4140698.1 hypothetical protein [Microbacterium invictum]